MRGWRICLSQGGFVMKYCAAMFSGKSIAFMRMTSVFWGLMSHEKRHFIRSVGQLIHPRVTHVLYNMSYISILIYILTYIYKLK